MLLFTRAPVAGRVKTRLIAALGAKPAADLHRRMTRRALGILLAAEAGPVTLFCSPGTRHPFFRSLKAEFGVPLRSQRGGDLGERMHHALEFGLARHRAALIIGSDCPGMDEAYLHRAAASLESGTATVVLGPAADGGYVLIGATRLDRRLFQGVPWGTEGVLDATRGRLRTLGWRWSELSVLPDIDRPEDLRRLDPALLP